MISLVGDRVQAPAKGSGRHGMPAGALNRTGRAGGFSTFLATRPVFACTRAGYKSSRQGALHAVSHGPARIDISVLWRQRQAEKWDVVARMAASLAASMFVRGLTKARRNPMVGWPPTRRTLARNNSPGSSAELGTLALLEGTTANLPPAGEGVLEVRNGAGSRGNPVWASCVFINALRRRGSDRIIWAWTPQGFAPRCGWSKLVESPQGIAFPPSLSDASTPGASFASKPLIWGILFPRRVRPPARRDCNYSSYSWSLSWGPVSLTGWIGPQFIEVNDD